MSNLSVDESMCYVCAGTIKEEEEDWIDCDCCELRFHLKCNNLTKAARNAQRGNKCVLIYCPECIPNRSNGADERIKMMQRFLLKLNFFNQQSKPQNVIDSNSIKAIVSKLDDLDKTNQLPKPSTQQYHQHGHATCNKFVCKCCKKK